MRGSELAQLRAFAMVVEQGSFVRAARQLHVTPSALSQTIRALEQRLGASLLHRTTRSVSLTEPGERLLERVAPAIRELDAAMRDVRPASGELRGALKLNVARIAAELYVAPLLAEYARRCPHVTVELVEEDASTDIVARRFDAGVRLGELLQRDMVAVPLSPDLELMAVASPDYLRRAGTPTHPDDLHRHRCITWRRPDGSVYAWELEQRGRELRVAIEGKVVVSDTRTALRAALAGAGITYLLDSEAAEPVRRRKLVRVLEPWSPRFPGFFLYYPKARHYRPQLRAFVELVREARRAARP